MRKLVLALVGIGVLAGCKGTEPGRFGALKSKITDGRLQSAVVAGRGASNAVNLSYREQLAVVPRWERALLPTLAYAQSSSQIRVQPGAVACVREDQTNLVPTTRCVTADGQGNSRFDWLTTPTRAGTYRALISSTYGLEATQVDSVTVTIVAGAFDSLLVQNWGAYNSPATLPGGVADKYGNAIAFRIVVPPSDTAVLKVRGDTLGTVAARTVTFTDAYRDTVGGVYRGPVELRIHGDTLAGRAWYRIGFENNAPAIFWRVRGVTAAYP